MNSLNCYQADFAWKWLKIDKDEDMIELHYIPVYFPDLSSRESIKGLISMKATHNRYLHDFKELHKTLFQPSLRFQGSSTSLREVIALYCKTMTN